MSDDKLELSRRKILGSVGAVGAAGAAAGLGTSALFSDQESFEGNSITAGTLDLKVSWDEHYFNGIKNLDNDYGGNIEFDSPGSSETGFPSSNGSPYLAVADGEVGAFMNDTRTKQFPEGGLGPDEDPCEELADVPGAEIPPPVIDLDDVKPGDFGEVTFDFSLCDNPGYLWMNGELVSESENGVTEPEGGSTAEDGSFNSSSLWPLAALAAPALGGGDDGDDSDSGGSRSEVEADPETGSGSQNSLWSTLGKGAAAAGTGVAGLSALTGSASAQQGFSVTPKSSSGDSATALAQSLVAGGTGISINSATYTGAETAAGTFSGGGSVYGLDSGVILSSGLATNIEESAGGPDNNDDGISVGHGTPGDSDLLAITDNVSSTKDAAVLEFDFDVPQGADTVFFNFVFGSDEYNEFVDEFNDVFGFFLNPDSDPTDDNVALVNGDPVSIDNINTMDNSGIFNNNDPGLDIGETQTATPFATEADGFTDVLQVEADVNPGEENTLKLAIADANDTLFDSWVLIEGGSLTTDPDPDPQPGDGTVELPDKVQARVWYDDGDNINQDDEEVILEGTLRQVLDTLSTGEGLPLDGDESTSTQFDETSDPPNDADRDCYTAADDVHYVGFEWWVPRSVGNEIQSDSVSFDLGFYTEQCRNNDGSGSSDDGDTAQLVINDQTANDP